MPPPITATSGARCELLVMAEILWVVNIQFWPSLPIRSRNFLSPATASAEVCFAGRNLIKCFREISAEFCTTRWFGEAFGLSDLPEAQSEKILPRERGEHLLGLLRHGAGSDD
jgi:hypothetical protein